MTAELILGECLSVMRGMADASVDAVVTDPPAGIAFMGKGWDAFGGRANANAESDRAKGNRGPGAGLGNQPFGYSGSALPKSGAQRQAFIGFLTPRLAEARRVAKPGAYLLCWAIPRTSHWTGCAIEDAGWRITDRLAHVFGQGFPKHKSKLKPAVEDWWLAWNPDRKATPLPGLERCRVGTDAGWSYPNGRGGSEPHHMQRGQPNGIADVPCKATTGRYPPNLLLSHSPGCNGLCVDGCPVKLMGEQSGERKGDSPNRTPRVKAAERFGWSGDASQEWQTAGFVDTGSAARFYPQFTPDPDPFRYAGKASRRDRGEGNTHPTVKPLQLCRWLVRLVTPPGGTVLDCFAGSGSTGVAALAEGFGFVGIDESAEYLAIARARIAAARESMPLLTGAPA